MGGASAYSGGMTTTQPTITTLYDAETGEKITQTQNPAITDADRRAVKGWVLRYRSAYGRRTGHKIRVETTPVTEEN
jgi:hypothetical protein